MCALYKNNLLDWNILLDNTHQIVKREAEPLISELVSAKILIAARYMREH